MQAHISDYRAKPYTDDAQLQNNSLASGPNVTTRLPKNGMLPHDYQLMECYHTITKEWNVTTRLPKNGMLPHHYQRMECYHTITKEWRMATNDHPRMRIDTVACCRRVARDTRRESRVTRSITKLHIQNYICVCTTGYGIHW